ncbi:iron-hydroxamate ABC transporter substrate-binding protein [Bacillus sp. Au-Bac7]|uniref:iron-hydroxamate ABC transporter substrate-binding protein n=1 Tax=Bacillus sp. Au-Bac7 TaxID=2906458 RepID=UPI001E495105|nr:iron-hydroxamate ABC transporter substrate-binding protein [Bacillus sp. Au-Bac7]MCE4049125.1 iron-hydroxamate ABC transporter substrate-binding protein [Bacillus sp. Au-Bac7]
MSKKLIPFILLLVLIISACGNKTTGTSGEETKKEEDSTITYESENGPIEVPADPQRVVALTNAGYVLKLGVNLVGVDSWSMTNPRYADELKDVEVVSEENIEKIAELQPDLIIAASTTKNIDKLGKIAPTVTYTYNKVDYLTLHLEIGKLLNKEKEAQAWIDDFKARAKAAGEEIKAKIGEDATVTVLESYDKSMYILGDSWGRGTEILYQAMGLKMPEKVKEMTEKEGYYTLSSEVLPEYVGDYLVISKYNDQDNSYQETDVYKNIPAVKNNHVLEANAYEFIFNDPISLDYQLDFFKENFLK